MAVAYIRNGSVWVPIAGAGDVVGPSSATDEAIARFDGVTGKLLQNSNSTISDAGVVTHDDGSGNTVVITPHVNRPKLQMLGVDILDYQPLANFLEIGVPGVTIGLPNSAVAAPMNVVETGTEPSTPLLNDMYVDDGTNTGSGNPGWRRYTGTVWEDVTAAPGGGGLADGDPIATLIRWVPPGDDAAHLRGYAGGSTPPERWPVWSFAGAGSGEYLDIDFELGSNYPGEGIKVRAKWSADSATSGDIVLQAAIRRIADDAEQTSASHTYVYNTVTSTAPSPLKKVKYAEITFTDGADMDGWAAGELGRVRILRDPSHGSDGMSGDAFIHSVTVVAVVT